MSSKQCFRVQSGVQIESTLGYVPVVVEQHVEEDIERVPGAGGLEDPGKPGGGEGGGLNLHQDLGHGEAVTEVSCGARLDHDEVIVRLSS